MALYKSEFWVQMGSDDEPQLNHTQIYESNTDRKIKMHISNLEKFFPDFSTPWKVIEDGEDFKIWRRAIKDKVLQEWNDRDILFDHKELQRFVIVKKAISDQAEEILREQYGKPIRVFTTY